MTWQEELRQLDSALAGGELSANEYRKRRDEILAAASSAQPPSPVIGPPTGPQPVVVAGNGDTTGGNTSAGNSSAENNSGGDNAEVTQIVSVEGGGGEADKTQIIDASAAAGTAAGVENGNAERTQVITAGPQPPVAHQQQQQQPQGWSTQLPDPTAPTGVFPRPPQPVHAPAVTPMDAQDLFTSGKPATGGKKPWLIAVVVLVVLALAGGAVWFFGFKDSGEAGNTAQEQPPTEEAKLPPPVDITKIELPGKPGRNSGEMDIARASELSVVAPAEGALIADAGADQLVYSGTVDGDYHYLLYAYKSDDAKAAAELTGKLLDIQERLGYKKTAVGEVPDSVTVTTVSNEAASGMRGVYTYGNTTIQLSVLQIPAGSIDDLRVSFQRSMTAVTDAAPPAK